MADVYEKNLNSKASLTVNDYIRVVGSDTVSYKQLVSDVANKIITTYTGASLAGSNQSVKSALDSLNSNLDNLGSIQSVFSGYKAAGTYTFNLDADKAYIIICQTSSNNASGIYIYTSYGVNFSYSSLREIAKPSFVSVTASSGGHLTVSSDYGFDLFILRI